MSDPFTIRIFVPDGDPEGVRLIDRMNWTGLGLIFPRQKWPDVRQRPDIARTGVYILVGYQRQDDDLPTVYIGQSDDIRSRLDEHILRKDFWDWAAVFVSNANALNRAHVTWMEHALVKRATEARRSHLDDGNAPTEPTLSEAEKADTRGFLKEILQILPLVGLRVFEKPQAVATPRAAQTVSTQGDQTPTVPAKPQTGTDQTDTIIVPAQKDGFDEVFMGEDAWYAIRIAGGMLDRIKYIAAYQTQPVSAITHVAPVARIEPYGEDGKYKVVFAAKAEPVGPVAFADAPKGAMQGIRYTSLARLRSARKLTDLMTPP